MEMTAPKDHGVELIASDTESHMSVNENPCIASRMGGNS